MLKTNHTLRGLLLAAFMVAGAAVPALAQITFQIHIAPPTPLYEAVPMQAPGYLWVPGYWAWNNDQHIWVRGRSIMQRSGYRWEADRWEQRGQVYYRHPGRWERDAGYQVVELKKAKKPKHGDQRMQLQEREHGKSGKHGKGHN